MTDRFRDQPTGATPLEEDDLAGLRLDWVITRAELDEAESANNLRGRTWAFAARGRSAAWLLTPRRLHQLHQRMYGDVWTWAGKPRRRDTNIGVDWMSIPVELQNLCDNVIAQVDDGANPAYPALELAVRFHHLLVSIHPYPNGNGRHSRLAADLLADSLGADPITWGSSSLVAADEVRARYLSALRKADRHDYADLIAFAQS
jgi:Fic-DOC domain mobile mystery protein B